LAVVLCGLLAVPLAIYVSMRSGGSNHGEAAPPRDEIIRSNLTNCPDCGKLISRSAATCPNCGRPFSQRG
jgi:predicted RNA-binding Zn-ribbon protein involved in translation (DUF1610 family)